MSISAQFDRIMPRPSQLAMDTAHRFKGLPPLRPYQTALIQKGREANKRGIRRFVLVLPTGGGKSVCTAAITHGAVAKRSRVLALAWKTELVGNLSDKMDKWGVDHGIVMADHPRWRPHAPVQVASIPTLVQRLKKPDFNIGDFNIIFSDECQHDRAASVDMIRAKWPNALMIGLTATPCRTDGKGLGAVYEELVLGPSVKELTDLGALVPFDGFSYGQPDLSGLRAKKSGDYDEKDMDRVMREVVISGGVIRDYVEFARGLRALVFAVNVEHSRAMVDQALAAGISAEHVDANTDKEVRKGVWARLASGVTMLVSNVGVALEGTDVPSIQCVILARPTASLALSKQMPGRGLRPWCFTCSSDTKDACKANGHDYKRVCRIHDHAGILTNSKFGLPDDAIEWTLSDDPPKRTHPAPTKNCPKCKSITAGGTKFCVCGHEFLSMEGMSETLVTEAPSARLTIEELRKRRAERGAGLMNLTDHELKKVHSATRDDKLSEYLRLKNVQREKGFKEKFPDAQFRSVFGHWPRFTDEEMAEAVAATKSFIPYKRDRQ